MKKLLTFLTLLTLSIGISWATDVTFNPSDFSGQGVSGGGNNSIITATKDGVTFTCTNGYGYSTGQIRCFAGGTITISSDHTITGIKFTFTSNSYTGGLSTTYTNLSTNSWSATVTGSAARISKIVVTYEGGTTPTLAYSLTLPTGLTGGTVTSNYSGDLTQITSGTSITVTATPATGYTLEWMKANGVDVTDKLTASLEYIFNINGNTTITASFVEESTPSGTEYTLVTNANDIVAGGEYLIVNSDKDAIAGNATSSDKYFKSVTTGFTVKNNSIFTTGDSHEVFTLINPTSGSGFYLKGKTLYYTLSASSSNVTPSTAQNLASPVYIYLDNNGFAYIGALDNQTPSTSNRKIGYNTNASPKRFAGYNPTVNGQQKPVYLYKKVEAAGAHTITLTQPTEGGTISASSSTADANATITVTATPAEGYQLNTVTVTPEGGTAFEATVEGNTATFTMPDANVTLTATFSKTWNAINTSILPTNCGGEIWVYSGTEMDGVKKAQLGDDIYFRVVTDQYNSYQLESLVIKDANNNTISYVDDPSDSGWKWQDGRYGAKYKFAMPGTAVTITATFKRGDLYLLGTANEVSTWTYTGPKLNYDGTKYSIDVYFKGADENDKFGYFSFTTQGNASSWGDISGKRLGANDGNETVINSDYPEKNLGWNENAFKIPAGIYTIEVAADFSKVTITPKTVNLTFSPAAGSTQYVGTQVTVSSNLYSLLHAINSSLAESAVTNEVSLDGTAYSSSVALSTSATSVTGRATYGQIAATATASYTVNEIPAGSEYTLVTDASVLSNGDQIVFMSKGSGSGYAMSTTQNNNNRAQTTDELTITNSKIIPNAETQIMTLEGYTGAWYFNVGDGYLYAASSGSNYLRTEETADDNAKAEIVIASDGAATITFQGDNTNNMLRHNANNKIYSCYASGQQPVYIFRKASATPMEQVATPTFSLAEGTYTEAQSVTISCATDGATILYSTDGTNYNTYSGAISVSETTTIYAKATKAGMTESEVAQATYTIETTPIEPGDGEFALVTNGNQIIAGREYIIVYYDSEKQVAAGAFNTSYFVSTDDVTLSNNNNIAEAGSEVKIFTLEDGSVSGTFYLKDTDGTYYTPNSSTTGTTATKNNLYVNYSGGNVEIKAADDNATYAIAYNNGSPRFTAYKISTTSPTGNQRPIYLYYRDAGLQKPVFTPNPGVYGIDVDVTISCPTSGATIYYTTDGTEPSATNGTLYDGNEIVVSQTTTFKAIAVKGEETSSVTEATYTISKSTDIATVTLDYREPFTEGVGNFYVVNESGFSPVWTLDGNYGIKGTSFSGGVNYAATSRFISPIIDMTDAVQPELTFSHQINSYFNDVTTQATLWIRETTDGTDGTWIQLPITFSDPAAAGGWTNDVVDIDLTDVNGVSYAGKKVQISFLYTNPTAGSGAGTWEIQNFVVADNSEYRMVNNIAEFLALENGTKAKFKNPVTVLYDYAQRGDQEYIWVKDESGYMQFFLQPTLNSSTESTLDPKAAYYENGDIIPAGFVVVKNYYENGKYVQAYSTEALDAGFELATQKGLADPDHYEFSTLNALTLSDADIAANCNRYITVEKVKIASKSGKNFTFANENGTVNACVGYNKYNGDGSLLKDGTTSADVTVPAVSNTYYNVKGIIQIWQGGWEFMPIEFTEWKADEVTLRKLCADGVENNEYKISNNLMGVYASEDGTKLWVKDDNGQSISPDAPDATYKDNFPINAEGNTRLDQALYDQSNWCEIQLTSENAGDFVGKIIKGGSIQGTFTNKTNPTMTGVTLTNDNIYSDGSYEPNYYIPCNFYGNQSCQTSQHGQPGHGDFFFMTPKPQEYAMVVWAIWDSENEQFVVNENPQYNSHGFQGSFKVDLSLNQNPNIALHDGMDDNFAYNFSAIIRVNSSKAGNDFMVYPLDLNAATDPATAIESVVAGNGEVKSVKFYNVAGIESATPFQGVNIVVTEYTDGSRTTSKMLRK